MSLAPIVLFYMLSKMGKGQGEPAKHGSRHRKDWPGPEHAPPQRAHHSKHHAASKPAHEPEHAAAHEPEHAAEQPSHAFAIGERCRVLPPKSGKWPDGSKASRTAQCVVRGYKGPLYRIQTLRSGLKMTVPGSRLEKAQTGAPPEHAAAPVHHTEAQHKDSPAHTDAHAPQWSGTPAAKHDAAEHAEPAHEEPKHASSDVEDHQGVDPVAAAQWIYTQATQNARWNWGTRNARNAQLAQAQSDMGLSPADADGVYGPATRLRGKQLLGKSFPIRGSHAAVSGGRTIYIP